MRHYLLAAALLLWAGAAAADDPADPAAAAEQAIRAFVEAVASGDQAAVGNILAPEYQIVRADGTGYDRDAYLAGGLPQIGDGVAWRAEDVVAAASGDHLVVRYHLVIDETIDGSPVARRAPRLTVFRRVGDRWLVVAHANFAAIR